MPTARAADLKRPISEWSAAVAIVVFVVFSGTMTVHGFRQLQRNREMVQHTSDVLMVLQKIESAMKDAETSHRGFAVTGRDEYLEPLAAAGESVESHLDKLAVLTRDNAQQQSEIPELRALIEKKLEHSRASVALRREGGFEAVQPFLSTNAGKQIMDSIRALIGRMQKVETGLETSRESIADQTYQSGLLTSVVSTVFAIGMIATVFYLIDRNRRRALKAAAIIQAEREHLRVTLFSIGDAVISTDLAGRVTNMNAVAESLTGWTKDQATGELLTQIFQIVNESTRLPVENPATRALKEGTIVGLANHTILIARDGSERPIDDSAAPIRNDARELVGCVLVFRDISERKEEENSQAERHRLVSLRADVSVALSAALTAEQTTQVALQQTCEAIVRHLDMAFARIWTLDDAGTVLELQSSAGIYTHLDGPHSRVMVGQNKIGRIAANRQHYLTNVVADDPEISNPDWAKEEGMVAFAGYPLMIEDRVVGVLAMFSRHMISEGVMLELAPIANGIAQFVGRRQQEAIREEAQRQITTTLESIADGFMRLDRDWRVVYFNAEAERMTQLSRSEVLGRTIWVLWPETIGTPLEIAYRRTLTEQVTIELENYFESRGQWHGLKMSPTPDGGLSVYFRDITLQKRADDLMREGESQFRMLADHIPQLAWIAEAGTNGEVHWFNRNWYDYTGTTLEEMQGAGWQKVHHPDHAERVIQKFQRHVRDSLDWEDTFPLRRHDGEFRWFLSRMKVIRDQSGKVMRIFGTNTDVTDQMQMAESLRRSAAELSEADRRKNEFLATLAHELRNPLAPIKNAVQLLGMTNLDNDTEDLRKMMSRQVEQLVRLIDDLLDVSRISRGKIVLRREVIDLASIVDAAVEASSTFITENNQKLNIVCPKNEIFVFADPARITQVISNLLNNSAKYSDAGCTIRLTVKQEDELAIIQVRDNGIGIAEDRLQDIFKLFSQVNDSLERGAAGLGIGLALVQTLVDMHGGSVTAESEGLGRGSLFTVQLPVADKRDVAQTHIKDILPLTQRLFRILIVEDQRALRVVLTRLLEKMGHEVESVESGAAAIARLDSYCPELIFSDISMPGMTGYELVRQLRQREDTRGIYIVAMTGFGQDTDRELAIQSGFDEHMVKPVDVDRLHDLFLRLSTRS